jgi:hypothetical protein
VIIASELLDSRHRFEVSFESVKRVVVELWVRRHMGSRIHRNRIGYLFSEVIPRVHSALGKHRPGGATLSPLSAAGVTEIVAGNTATNRDFLTLQYFRVVSALLWGETPERLVEAGQFEREHSGRGPWLFDVAVDRFGRAKRFMNDAVWSEPTVLCTGPVGGRFTIKLQEKDRPMSGDVITIVILLLTVRTLRSDHWRCDIGVTQDGLFVVTPRP